MIKLVQSKILCHLFLDRFEIKKKRNDRLKLKHILPLKKIYLFSLRVFQFGRF